MNHDCPTCGRTCDCEGGDYDDCYHCGGEFAGDLEENDEDETY